MFPYAATFTADPTGGFSSYAHCGATLISTRHLITAAHCTNHLKQRMFVLVDGVCVKHSWWDGCTDSGEVMRPVEIDFILTRYFYYGPRDEVRDQYW